MTFAASPFGEVAFGDIEAEGGASVPTLSGVTGTVRHGASITLDGSSLDGVTVVTFRDSTNTYSQAQTMTSQSAGAIGLTLDIGDVPWSDANHTVEFHVTDGSNTDALTVTHVVASGWALTTTSGTQVEAGDGTSLNDFITGTAVAGEQFAYQATTSGDQNLDTWGVTVNVDGTFEVAGGVGPDSFGVQHWYTTRGAAATVYLYDTEPTLNRRRRNMLLGVG
jgi:hypothetical protein